MDIKHQKSVVEIMSHFLLHINLSLIPPFIFLNWKTVSFYSMHRFIWISNPQKNGPSFLVSCSILVRVFCRSHCVCIYYRETPLISKCVLDSDYCLSTSTASLPALWNYFISLVDTSFLGFFVFFRNWPMEHLKNIVNYSAFPKVFIFNNFSVLIHLLSLQSSSLCYRNPRHLYLCDS